MSVDVSPDGTTIVFDLLGDLYTLPISGGRAKALTSGPALDGQPRFSPDGRRVVFVSDRSGIPNIWTVESTGMNPVQVSDLRNESDSPVSSPTWSPDGRTIVAAQRLGAVERIKLSAGLAQHPSRWLLAAYDVESAKMRWVTDTAASRARRSLGPAFGPDGVTIYAAVEPHHSAYGMELAWRIERVNLETGAVYPEMAPSSGLVGMRPAVSRDGRFLVYASVSGTRLGLRLRDLRTFEERWLVHERLDKPSLWDGGAGGETGDLVPGYAFTPDARALIVALDGKIHRIDVATGRARVIPFLVDVERELAPFQLHQFSLPDTIAHTRSAMQPSLSPDGAAVAFSALDRVWVMDLPHDGLPGGKPRRLTTDSVGEFYPSWAPDGKWIAYSVWQDGEGGAVRRAWVAPPGNGSLQRSERLTTDTAIYFNTVVALDGNRVAAVRAPMLPERILTHYSAEPIRSMALVWVPVAGGASTLIDSGGGPGGSEGDVQLEMSRHPVEQLYITPASGRIHVGLTSYTQDGASPRTDLVIADSLTELRMLNDVTGVISPDERRAFLTHNWTISEVTLPLRTDTQVDTVDIEQLQQRPLGAASGAAARWGRALAPWISWSLDGRRVLFVQGGTFFLGNVTTRGWTTFTRIEVPLPVIGDMPHGTLVLRGARLITMRGREVIARGDLVVTNNRITAVGPVGAVRIPSQARVLDVSGETILPGWVDIHDHLAYPNGVHPGQCWRSLVRLAHGVTAVRDPQASWLEYNDVFAYQERERTGDLIGPRIFSTGIPHIRSDRPVATLEDAHAVVLPTAEYFDAETFKEYSSTPWPQRRLVAMAAANAGLNATIHGNQLRAVLDGFSGVEHAIPIPLYDDVLTLIAKSGTTFTQTLGVIVGADGYFLGDGSEPWEHSRMRRFAPGVVRESMRERWLEEVSWFGHPEWDRLRPLLKNAAGLVARGGRVGLGSHGNIPGIGVHYEMWLHALGGMPNHEILRSATIVGATAIGHARDLGSLEAGKLADLQVLNADPLRDIRNTVSIRYIMKNGRLYLAEDLTEIWPRQKSLAPIYHWDARPSAQRSPANHAAQSKSEK